MRYAKRKQYNKNKLIKDGQFDSMLNDIMENGEVNDMIEDSIDKCVKKIVDDMIIKTDKGDAESVSNENILESSSDGSSPISNGSNNENNEAMYDNITYNIRDIERTNPERVNLPFTVFSNVNSFIGGEIP